MLDTSFSAFENFSATSYQIFDEDPSLWAPVFLEDVSSEKILIKGLTRAWLEKELTRGLLGHLTYLVSQRLPREDVDDIQGEVGVCIATWSMKGSFDRNVREYGHGPNRKLMAQFIFQTVATGMLHRGKDVQLRDRTGARTQSEVRAKRTAPIALKLDKDTWKAVTITDEATQEKSTEIVDKCSNPEQVSVLQSNTEACLETAKEILRIKCPRGAVRRVQVLEATVRGARKQELEETLGVSGLRVNFLKQEIRDDLREGLELLDKARKVLQMVIDEPCITSSELETDLGFTDREIKTTTRILIQKRLVTSSKDGSLIPTKAAYNEIF